MKSRILISFLLSLVIALNVPFQVFAAEKSVVYVSEVMVGMGETAEEAKKALTDAGFTVLDRDLNEGAGSALKTEKFVYLGYKTTADANEAITDLAVMNMNGGFSFSDYEVLMDKYRDSQIRPFVDCFIATIKEYRANYGSDDPGNRAKAEFVHSVLSHVTEDDSGGNMGDLLLNPTKEELGLTDDQYKALSADEKRKTVDLTKTLMQGNTQVVYLVQKMLAIASDTNGTTWLERLSELGPDGLEAKYAEAGVRPADAGREMAALYDDTAKTLLNGWVDLRDALLSYDMEFAGNSEGETAEIENVDLEVQFDVPVIDKDSEASDPEETADNIENVMDALSGTMENGKELYEATENSDIAGIYGMLKEMPYGDGTLYDFFTLEYDEVSGDNISAMYPLVSTLSEGQIAAINFLPLRFLMQIGATVGDAFEQFSPENSNMYEGIDFMGGVSIYLDVNRELFSDKVALTSEALREGLDKKNGWMNPDPDLLGLSRLTTLSWAVTGFFGAMTVVSLIKCATLPAQYSRAVDQYLEINGSIEAFYNNCDAYVDNYAELYEYATIRIDTWTRPGYTKVTFEYVDEFDDYVYDTEVMEKYYDGTYNIKDKYDDIEELEDEFENAMNSKERAMDRWGTMKTAFSVVFAVLTLISIGLTVYDLYRYYNVDYTPIPKYIVDEADITTLDEDGNQIVVRNDAAYYTVAKTNRPKTHEQYKALQDYADLNGDAGQEWLALYCTKNAAAGAPILADSFNVVTGSTSIPEGYAKGIHMFGSNAAANLTDNRYTYNDKLNGMYVYYLTEADAASTQAASTFSGGALALVGTGGAAVGASLGALAVVMVGKKKKNDAEA